MTYLQLDIIVRALENFKGYIVEHAYKNENEQFNQNAIIELDECGKIIEKFTIERDNLNTLKN